MTSERKVPVLRSDFNLIDKEFDSIRDRFEVEMKRMEEEMSRFRSQIQERERDFFSTGHLTRTESPTNRHRHEVTSWLDDSSLVHDTPDGKIVRLRYDVSQYVPEEIVVKTIDRRLKVHAVHEENTENRKVFREFNREFLLPEGVNPEQIRSTLSTDGILTVEAPLAAIEGSNERRIPIAHK
ncbi:heat shock protein beta-1-like [Panonychus citri]|uniref:heat shock protein beta-1-like n=1 Tax=Panonychus citri TaxID=50023 RepID=UPI00230725C8|nr:heat shock protein beta-1-like [Panonychus citri]